MKWKAKVDGRWYEVVDVEDQGDGLPNLYHLRNRAPVEQSEVEDLDVAASVSFLPQLQVLARKKDRRREMIQKELRQRDKVKNNKNLKQNPQPKPSKTPKKPKEKTEQEKLGLNKYGNLPAKREETKVVEPEVLDENNQPILDESERQTDVPDARERQDHAALQKIRSMENPKLFVVIFRNNRDSESKFLNMTKSLTDTQHSMLFFKGERGDLQGLYAFFMSASKEPEFERVAKPLGSPYMFVDLPEDFFAQDSPFDNLSFTELNQALAGDETRLKRELNEIMHRISDVGPGGQISAIRMAAEIPLDYARFISLEHRPVEYYLGGHPSNAGSPGTQFILATEAESRMFIKTMNGFKPLASFFNDLYYVSDIDPDFKDYNPMKISPCRALILQAKKKFDMDEKVTVDAGTRWLMDESEKIAPGKPFKDIVTQQELLEAFVRVFMERASGSKPGKFAKRRYFIGNDWVHINRDGSVAILWGARTSAISLDKQKVLKHLPFVKDALLTFLK